MYVPKSFELSDADVVRRVLHDFSFGTLVSVGAGGMQASHLPFVYDAAGDTLRSHMARANSQWRDFAVGTEVMAVFQGPHAYISPQWYETEPAVPTWNYVAVHVYGTPRIIEDDDQVAGLLRELVTRHESRFPRPWSLLAPADWQANMRQAVVAVEVAITRIEAKAKMSQNRSVADVAGVVAGLENQGDDVMVKWMREFNPA